MTALAPPRHAIDAHPVDPRALSDATVLRRVKGWVLAMLEIGKHRFLRVAPLPPRKKARGAFDPPCTPRPENRVGTRDVPTHRRYALAARRRTRDVSPTACRRGRDHSLGPPDSKSGSILKRVEGLTNPKENETDNRQWQQPNVTAYRSPAPLRPAQSGVHDHRNRCSRSTGLAVHDHRNTHFNSQHAKTRAHNLRTQGRQAIHPIGWSVRTPRPAS